MMHPGIKALIISPVLSTIGFVGFMILYHFRSAMDADMAIMAPYIIGWGFAVFTFLSGPAYLILSVPNIADWMKTGYWKSKFGFIIFSLLGIFMIAIDIFFFASNFQKGGINIEVAVSLATGTVVCFSCAGMLLRKTKAN